MALAAGEVEEDPTATIDLVWVPGDDDDVESNDQTELVCDEDETGVAEDVVDQHTGLTHDPRNGGTRNQTGEVGQTRYSTRSINGRNYTLDRARAHARNVEEHKSWIVNQKGVWKQWPNYTSLDWSNADQVERMNKWREQAATRAGWPGKRQVVRPDYTEEYVSSP